jgi:alpha-beta hydrolase superfamily lysophospholipase
MRAWIGLLLLVAGCGEAILSAPEVIVIPNDGGAGPSQRLDASAGDQDAGISVDPPTPDAAAQRLDRGVMRDMDQPVDMRPPPDMAPRPDMAPMDQGPPAAATCEDSAWTLTIAGQQRRVRFEVPPNPSQGAPRVLLLHGNGGDENSMCGPNIQLCSFLNARGALVASPAGRDRNITAHGQQLGVLSWDAYDPSNDNEDVLLTTAIIAEIDRRCGPGPLYVWGHSQGGYFAYLVAMGYDVHGAVISAAADPMPGWPWQPARALPLALIIGTLDYGIDNARDTIRRLQASGHPTRLIEIDGAQHGPYLNGHNPEMSDFIGLR